MMTLKLWDYRSKLKKGDIYTTNTSGQYFLITSDAGAEKLLSKLEIFYFKWKHHFNNVVRFYCGRTLDN